jgi:hypothetical protein
MPRHSIAIYAGIVAAYTSAGAAFAIDLSAPRIGDWNFSDLLSSAPVDQPRQYFISSTQNLSDDLSPTLDIMCQGGSYRLRYINGHRRSKAWRGNMNLLLDHGRTRAIGAAAEPPFDQPVILITSDILSRDDLQAINDARDVIEVSFDGWNNQLAFPAHGIDAALAALASACSYDPKRNR